MDVKNFEVSEELMVGQKVMDSQHKEFFKRLNTLIVAAASNKNQKEIQSFIRFLSDYIQTHLSMEERLMQKYGYKEFEGHKSQHDYFRKVYTEIMDDFSNGKLSLSDFVKRLEKEVGEWFENHIQKVDKLLGAFLVEEGAGEEEG
ncbi:MAG: bacteriohemerythrin [Spirochaetia bacterium]|nr:bacteriohemerythrin [Spirochaetia bacterium]